ncbi:MAG: XRE family transcriptional regulator [Cytophagales bacterium]|nr:MAG: XRE family transcriptional regulator [Cytophagales bacterium]
MLNTGDKIRKKRTQKGLSQQQMADYLNISQNSYHKIETNETNVKFETLIKIAEMLEAEVTEFIPDVKLHCIQSKPFITSSKSELITKPNDYQQKENLLVQSLRDKDEIIKMKDEKIAQLQHQLLKMLSRMGYSPKSDNENC